MASNIMRENGHEPTPTLLISDVKVLVVGKEKCGKSSFIKAFHKNNSTSEPIYAIECARVYPCRYELRGNVATNFKIYEILGGSEELVKVLTGVHTETNGFIIMYAIDDPSSFQEVKEKWIPVLSQDNMWEQREPAIAVGTKRDLRNDPQVIQRLANNNQAPVTEQEGKSLVGDKISRHFECSPFEDSNVNDAFNFILKIAFEDLIANETGYLPPLLHPNNYE